MIRTLILTALLTLSCAHTRADEMTAAEHRSEAARHEEAARQERERFQPGRTIHTPGRGPFLESPADATTSYNPTADHLVAADAELRRAASHLAAARKLEAFESAACREIAPAERAACPLLASSVTQVRHTDKGLELVLKPQVDGADTNRRLNCHLAYAAANGFAKPSCPLFVKGMAIRLQTPNVIEMTGDSPEAAKDLQDQARRIFVGEPNPAVSQTP